LDDDIDPNKWGPDKHPYIQPSDALRRFIIMFAAIGASILGIALIGPENLIDPRAVSLRRSFNTFSRFEN
jgi:hypothetical protein